MPRVQFTPSDWFAEAVQWYAEKHQACPWCGGANRVYKSKRGATQEYNCGACDFFACHDLERDQYFMAPGQKRTAPLTMFAFS